MNCCIDEICNKDVINIENGCRVGYVFDVEIDTCSGQISKILVTHSEKAIQFKRPECLKISWEDIVVMGEETILVKNIPPYQQQDKQSKNIFNIFSK